MKMWYADAIVQMKLDVGDEVKHSETLVPSIIKTQKLSHEPPSGSFHIVFCWSFC